LSSSLKLRDRETRRCRVIRRLCVECTVDIVVVVSSGRGILSVVKVRGWAPPVQLLAPPTSIFSLSTWKFSPLTSCTLIAVKFYHVSKFYIKCGNYARNFVILSWKSSNSLPPDSDFKAKMHQIQFGLGLRPRPRRGELERLPRPLAAMGGSISKGRGGRGGGEGSPPLFADHFNHCILCGML